VIVTWRDETGELREERVEDPTALLHELTGAAIQRGEQVHDLTVTRPSLEDVYLELTHEEAEDVIGV
jgi:ABC-2 type transport system ATP-binding protein